MDTCNVFLVDPDGGKRPYPANLNHRLEKFLEVVSILTGTKNTAINLGDRIYGQDSYNTTLRNLGLRPGMDVELMATFKGGSQ